ncbi:serine/threonine-protein kinase [Actinopolymorpha pittospori]
MQGDLAENAATVELTRLGGYVLRERIGEGGMGVVHRATDVRGRVVAVKVLRPHVAGDAESRARFAREARVLARVRGRHIAQVLDTDVAAAMPYLVTEFVDGPPLYEVVEDEGPLEGPDLADLAGDLADALCSIHGAGVVHRDLKPGNVLIEDGIAVVIDFGIAQIADDTRMTMPGLVYGTPGYVAPEILSGAEITPAADVHAWAATVTYAATGRAPFGKGPLEAVAYRVLHDEPDLSGCPPWLAPVLGRCFAKDPGARPTAPHLLRWLETGEEPPPVAGGTHGSDASAEPTEEEATGWFGAGAPGPASRLPAADPYPTEVRDDAEDGYPTETYVRDAEDGYPTETYGRAAETYPYEHAAHAYDETVADGRYDADHRAGPVDPAPTRVEESPEEQATVPSQPAVAPRTSHRLVTALAFGVLGTLAAVLPAGAAIGLVGWLLLARTVDRSAEFVEGRRAQRGRRRTDGVVAALALPWHLLRSAVVTALTLPIAAVGAGLLVAIVALFFYVGGISPRWDIMCGAAGLAMALLAWWGVRGQAVQRGTERVLHRVVGRRRWAAVAAGAALAVFFLLLLTIATGEPVYWWPFQGQPLPRFDWAS